MVHPIIDEYYSYNPYHARSSQFAQDKGLVTNEKTASPGATTPGETTPSAGKPESKKHLAPSNLHETIQSLSPQMHARTHSHEPLSRSSTPGTTNSTTSPPARSPDLHHRDLSPHTDIRRLSSLSDGSSVPSKPQEQGNTKKKREPISGTPQQQHPLNVHSYTPSPQEEASPPGSPTLRSSFGDPAKIAQYFPELHSKWADRHKLGDPFGALPNNHWQHHLPFFHGLYLWSRRALFFYFVFWRFNGVGFSEYHGVLFFFLASFYNVFVYHALPILICSLRLLGNSDNDIYSNLYITKHVFGVHTW